MATLFQVLQFFDGNGDPASGWKLRWDAAGTSTPKNIFTDQSAGTPLPNPVILDSEGRIPRPDRGGCRRRCAKPEGGAQSHLR